MVLIQRSVVGTACVGVLSVMAGAAGGATGLRAVQIMQTGSPAPGMPGFTIDTLDTGFVSINEAGRVALGARVTGPGVTSSNEAVLLAGDPAGLMLIGRENSDVPGAVPGTRWSPVASWSPFSQPAMSDAGVVLHGGITWDGSSWGSAFVLGAPASIGAIAFGGKPAVDPPGSMFVSVFGDATVSGAGVAALRASVDDGGVVRQGVWTISSGATLRVALSGDPAPQLPGLVFGSQGSQWGDHVVMNDAGEVLFIAALSGPGVTGSNNEVLYAGVPGGITLQVRKGSVVPGSGRTYQAIDEHSLRINNAGAIVFLAQLNAGQGIVGGPIGNISKIVQWGDPAPVPEAGATFTFLGRPELSGDGTVVFRAQFTGPGITGANDSGIFRWDGSSFELLFREGDLISVAGWPADATMGNCFDSLRSYLAINTRGDMVFGAMVSGTGLSGNAGLLYRAASGEVFNVATSGKLVAPVNAGAFNPTSSLASGGMPVGQPAFGGSPECGRAHALNEQGVFAARVREGGTSNERWLLFVPFTCDGDADGNSIVDVNDISSVIFRLGSTGLAGTVDGDADGNGVVDVNDVAFVVFRLGDSCP